MTLSAWLGLRACRLAPLQTTARISVGQRFPDTFSLNQPVCSLSHPYLIFSRRWKDVNYSVTQSSRTAARELLVALLLSSCPFVFLPLRCVSCRLLGAGTSGRLNWAVLLNWAGLVSLYLPWNFIVNACKVFVMSSTRMCPLRSTIARDQNLSLTKLSLTLCVR